MHVCVHVRVFVCAYAYVCVRVHMCVFVYSQDGGPVVWEVQQDGGFLGVGGGSRSLGV